MQMSRTEKEKFIHQLFSSQKLFEKYILDVYGDDDRLEIMEILSDRIVNILLRDEFNFLYMRSLKNFKFSLVVNILFKEIANEWVFYAQEQLLYSKEEALNTIQDKERVLFLLKLIKSYFNKYKICFAQNIADSFIKLIQTMPDATLNNELIKRVLRSGFVKDKNIAIVINYSQLWNRVRQAHNNKNRQLAKYQVEISELSDQLKFNDNNEIKESELLSKLKRYEFESEVLENKSLAYFDDAIKRLRNTMISYILSIDSFKAI